MKVVNTDGLSLIGPGSEWLWSMLQFVIVAITLYAIYRQLKIARDANAFEHLSRISTEWTTSERLTRFRLDVLLALRDGADRAELPEGAAASVADFWEGVASLVRAGHVDLGLVYDALGGSCRWWWAALEPYTRRTRLTFDDPAIGEHHEWLAREMAAMDRKAGVTPTYDGEAFTRSLATRIRGQEEAIRVAEAMRTVSKRPIPTARARTAPRAASDTPSVISDPST